MLPRFVSAFLCLALVGGEARAEWREAVTPHFIIYSEEGERTIHERAARLEALDNLLQLASGTKDEIKPYRVRIYVVATRDDVQHYANQRGTDLLAFYQGATSGPFVFTPAASENGGQSANTLQHEYVHHFMLQHFPVAYPAWFVEGRAELVSTASFEHKGFISYGKVADHRQYELQSGTARASTMLTTNFMESEGSSSDYGSAWLLTHYLTFAPERKGQLAAFLAALNAGQSRAEAAKVFGDLGKLDRDVGRYLEAANFTYREVPLPTLPADAIRMRVLTADEAAVLQLEMESKRRASEAETKALKDKVAALATRSPRTPSAQRLLAEVALDADDLETARRAADAYAALAPGEARALYLRGQAAYLAAQKAEGDAARQLLTAARHDFVEANRADPDDPLPLVGFFRAQASLGGKMDNAIAGLIHAQEIAPQDAGLRLQLASVLKAQNQRAAAAMMLRPLAYSPHRGSAAKEAAKMLDELEGRATAAPAAATAKAAQ